MTLRRLACMLLIFLFPAWLGQSVAQTAGGGLHQRKAGLEAYVGVIAAEITKGHASTKGPGPMHGGVPRGEHQYHVVAAIFDANSGERVSEAKVTAQVSGIGLAGPIKPLEPMQIAGTITYGGYFNLPGADLYTIVLSIQRPGASQPVTLTFSYDHRNR